MNDDDLFTNIRKGDILHHPYQSFDPVVRFVRDAARDPEVLAIKQTFTGSAEIPPSLRLWPRRRTTASSVGSGGIEGAVRRREQHQLGQKAGKGRLPCHLRSGGIKTHSKITLVVRREEDGIRRYVHLGTGNYNDSTAKLYTDCGILTCNPQIGEDATAVFNMLSGYSEPLAWNRLVVAPLWLRKRFCG